jgi:ribosomal protein S17
VVEIDVVQRHRRYRKILRSTIKLVAHDEANTATRATPSASSSAAR